ncbi:hypothetical protein BJY04DRAFT_215356 [Aspergillus karnatakaensis]|uniref:uncharacterized protein n=1 Tax=Aspergillus karnatakaensis TaxID=1810916 RepID=UPI003CCD27F4
MTEIQIPLDSLPSLKDKVILITGASSGIGLATVRLCLSLSAKIIAGDINPPPADLDADEPSLLFVPTDVSNWNSLRNLFVQGVKRFGGIDHVFANAGIAPRCNFLEETFDAAQAQTEGDADENADGEKLLAAPDLRTINVNLIGVIYTVRLGAYYLRRRQATNPPSGESTGDPDSDTSTAANKEDSSPSIVLTASASSFQNFSGGDYTVAKHGVLGILRALVVDLLVDTNPGRKVRLNAIAPSWTATGIVAGEVIRDRGAIVQEPEDVAKSVVLLFGDERRHGEVIYSWGGRYCEINQCKGGLLDGAARIVPNIKEEGAVMERIKGRYIPESGSRS